MPVGNGDPSKLGLDGLALPMSRKSSMSSQGEAERQNGEARSLRAGRGGRLLGGEPSLAEPENVAGSQMTWLRGNDQDREADQPETVLREDVVSQPQAEPQPTAEILPWRGRGNVIAAAGVALLDLLDRERA